MHKWEYLVEIIASANKQEIEDKLNSFGQENWELVSEDGERFVFKRQVEVFHDKYSHG